MDSNVVPNTVKIRVYWRRDQADSTFLREIPEEEPTDFSGIITEESATFQRLLHGTGRISSIRLSNDLWDNAFRVTKVTRNNHTSASMREWIRLQYRLEKLELKGSAEDQLKRLSLVSSDDSRLEQLLRQHMFTDAFVARDLAPDEGPLPADFITLVLPFRAKWASARALRRSNTGVYTWEPFGHPVEAPAAK